LAKWYQYRDNRRKEEEKSTNIEMSGVLSGAYVRNVTLATLQALLMVRPVGFVNLMYLFSDTLLGYRQEHVG